MKQLSRNITHPPTPRATIRRWRKGKKVAFRIYADSRVIVAEHVCTVIHRSFFQETFFQNRGSALGWLPTRGYSPRVPLEDVLHASLGVEHPELPRASSSWGVELEVLHALLGGGIDLARLIKKER